jgi:hypothetical protein
MEKFKVPFRIIQKLKITAPTYEVGENRGMRMDYHSEYEQTVSGYRAVCIYVQNGLSIYNDLFKEVAKGVFSIQTGNQRKYPLFVFGFGKTSHLQHENKYFDFGYLNDSSNVSRVAEAIANISGSIKCNPAIISELFPKTGTAGLYRGKTSIEREDLLVIIGKENQVFLDETLKNTLYYLKKQILLVEIGKDEVLFKTREINFEFKPAINPEILTTMPTPVSSFKRNLSNQLITKLQKEPFYQVLYPEIQNQIIFPGIRNNLIDFYYKGGRLFKYDNKGFQTHIKYAAVIEKGKRDYLTENELGNYKLATDFSKNYQRIKENCSIYSGVEANGVSEIYRRHSYVGREKGIVVLDIEVSLKSIVLDNKQDRIDILLYNADERKLKFVEVKHYSNSEIWSDTNAKVIGQIARYEAQIMAKKSQIISEYNKYINYTNNLFNGKLPHAELLDEKVTLLIFGFDSNQRGGRLEKLVTGNSTFNNVILYPIGNVKQINLTNLWKAKL